MTVASRSLELPESLPNDTRSIDLSYTYRIVIKGTEFSDRCFFQPRD